MQAAFAISVGLVALAPVAAGGLLMTIIAVLVARILWAGILTVRAAVWSANYPRHVMARITGRIVIVSSLGVASGALVVGRILDLHARARALAVPVRGTVRRAGGAALPRGAGAARVPVAGRGDRQQLRSPAPSVCRCCARSCAANAAFRRYMFWMSLYGSGNLMMTAQLVVLFSDRLHLASLTQILLLTVVPMLMMPLFLPWWARLFDRGHIIEYRSRQCWALVAAIVLLTLGRGAAAELVAVAGCGADRRQLCRRESRLESGP